MTRVPLVMLDVGWRWRDLNPRLPPCEICTGPSPMDLHAVEDRESEWRTPGQWLSTGGSAVIILHSFRADTPVVTHSGCCPSAARGCSSSLERAVDDLPGAMGMGYRGSGLVPGPAGQELARVA